MFRRLTSQQLTVDIVVAALCFLLRYVIGVDGYTVIVVILMASALAIRRLSPGLALGVAWGGAIIQMGMTMSPEISNLAILAVLFATARYGTPRVRWLGLASAGGGAIIATLYFLFIAYGGRMLSPGNSVFVQAPEAAQLALFAVIALASALAVLGLSWTLGLLARTRDTARDSRRRQAAAEQEVVV